MRRFAEKIGGYLATDGFAAAQPLSELAGFTAPALTLPDLAAPATLLVADNQQWWTELAVALLDAGVVRARSIRAKEVNAYRLAQQALDAWIAKRTGTLTMMGMAVNLSDGLDGAVGLELDVQKVAEERKEPLLLDERPKVYFGNQPQNWGFVRLQKAYEALEGVAQGLGQTVWYYLDRWLMAVDLNAYTPGRAEDDQINYRWWGENDETEFRAQFSNDKEFEESGCLTRVEFDRLLPPTVVRPKRILSQRAIRAVYRAVPEGSTERELLRLFWRGVRLIGKGHFGVFPREGIAEGAGDYMEQIAPTVFVRWNDDDPVVDIFDDMGNHYQNGGEGYYEGAMGFDWMALDDAQAFRQWLPKASRYFRAVGLLDRMLTLIEGYNE